MKSSKRKKTLGPIPHDSEKSASTSTERSFSAEEIAKELLPFFSEMPILNDERLQRKQDRFEEDNDLE